MLQLLFLASALAFSGCAAKPINSFVLSENSDLTQEIAQAEDQLMDLRNDNASFLVPDQVAKAEIALRQAKELRAHSKPNSEVLAKVSTSRGFSQDAKIQLLETRPHFKGVLDSRQFAESARAPEAFPKLWNRAEREMQRLARLLGRNNQGSALNDVEVLRRQYLELESKAAVAIHLQSPRREIESAKADGARKWVPRALQHAETEYEIAKKAIQGSPRNLEIIRNAASDAQKASTRLIQIIRRARLAEGTTSEETLLADLEHEQLYREYWQKRERELESLHGPEDKDRLNAEQRGAVLESIIATNEEALNKQRKQGETLNQNQKISIQDRNRSLAQSLESKANQLRTLLGSTEADVLVRTPAILIRVKTPLFDENSAEIRPQNQLLFDRLKNAISELRPKSIWIEGHTDASESAEDTSELSLRRADAVKHLFLENGEFAAETIDTMGFGTERPLRGGDSREAHQMGKRIDFVIQPEL